jgi:NADPH:quinone reductase-like Zn-dependent oxidoreductase
MARSLGALPILISGSLEKIKLAESMGVEHAVNYRDTPDWDQAILELTAGQGCDRIVEVIGGQSMRRSIRCLRPGGTISYIGCLGGFDGDIDILELMYKNAKLEAIYVGSRRDLECVVQDMRSWGIAAMIDDQSFSFDSLPQALERLRAGEHVGKIVIEL